MIAELIALREDVDYLPWITSGSSCSTAMREITLGYGVVSVIA
jgi:hypothetical protein